MCGMNSPGSGPLAKLSRLIAVFVLVALVGACGGESMTVPGRTVDSVSSEEWGRLSGKQIVFGHQSVGRNIVDGLIETLREHPQIDLNIDDLANRENLPESGFFHYLNGTNKQPLTKIRSFQEQLGKEPAKGADIAFFKFCYVDVRDGTNVAELFEDYKTAISGLKESHPETRIVHVTVPLTTVQTGPKAWIKKLIGRPLDGVADNIQRARFSQQLIEEYGGDGAVFDLARIESTMPDGSTVTFSNKGHEYAALAAVYSDDGGHLNRLGKSRVAEELLLYLVSLSD